MLQQLVKIPDVVNAEYVKYTEDVHRSMPSLDTYMMLLTSCITEFFNLYANRVFDAYDEFKNGENEVKERANLLSCLRHVCLNDHARLLITTRLHCREELRNNFPATGIMDIEADLADIDDYLNDRMQNVRLHPDLERTIKTSIRAACQRW